MLHLSSSALKRCVYHPLESSRTHLKSISAPFEITNISLETKNLTIQVKANDKQKCLYHFFNLVIKEDTAELHIRRRIRKVEGEINNQDLMLDVSAYPEFNSPLKLKIYRTTVQGKKLIREANLKP